MLPIITFVLALAAMGLAVVALYFGMKKRSLMDTLELSGLHPELRGLYDRNIARKLMPASTKVVNEVWLSSNSAARARAIKWVDASIDLVFSEYMANKNRYVATVKKDVVDMIDNERYLKK